MGNATVAALYRHPVKSMTPESVTALQLTQDGRVEGDRVLAFRFSDAGDPADWNWQTKHNFVGLVNTPGLAKLNVEFSSSSNNLRLHTNNLLLAEGKVDSKADREKIATALTDHVMSFDVNPLTDHPERQPVRMVGDGKQPLFHDTPDGLVTMYSVQSLKALRKKLDDPDLDGRRFRANIVIDGVDEPFEEFSWIGRHVRVGKTVFEVTRPVTRCLVTHANPLTGERDRDILNTLTHHFTPDSPQFAVMLQALPGNWQINCGDSISLV